MNQSDIAGILAILVLLVGGLWLISKGIRSIQMSSKSYCLHPTRHKLLGWIAVLLAAVMLCSVIGMIPSVAKPMREAADIRHGMTATSLTMTAKSIAMTATREYERLHPTITPTPTRTPMPVTSKDYCYASFNYLPITLRGVFKLPKYFLFCYEMCYMSFIIEETGVQVGVSIPESRMVAFTTHDTKFYTDDGQLVGLGETVILQGVVVYKETFHDLTPTPEVDCHLSISSIIIP